MLVYVLPGTLESREDDLDLLWEAGATGLEERGGLIRAYFSERLELEGPLLGGEWTEEEDRDWQAAFKRDLRPVQAGRITIAPPWLADEVPATQLPLIIEPGMAFGTGHHATTRLAVGALSNLDLTGKKVLDVGTGSGVLAMAAARLGAALAYGVDIDPLTIPVARANAEQNDLHAPQVQFEEGTLNAAEFAAPADHSDLSNQGYDVLVANLFAELHDILAATYLLHLRPGGQLILTGILEDRLDVVQAALSREGVQDTAVELDGEWALVTGRKAEQAG
ncbi:50S ribosomal protein L11 methyltransferase [Deinococcus radiophilus]|uniref:Ribosomal protein L11 methyltransferase n=1 Tax=Deinococcus radiophilus TaxID=32062 RepID=A0A3S0IC51_9DEIO|nr:50S ribosomal protein L11 methyltransferase [Deinococcus radiophilus]RTR30283.1 50S ribosomal protein L11 methyltransferase [Deinococcus radiophilus]UFA49921.1 50S ribosomal protein L11 methyltransferase [Deinococcus radiophilus]